MIVTDDFSWGHMPKTAGDATSAFFINSIPDKIIFADPDDNNKHAPFSERIDLIKDKKLILNIRRLPNFILSFIYHHLFTGGISTVPDKAAYFDKNYKLYLPPPYSVQNQPETLSTLGDWMIDYYVANFNIDYWLRCENIQSDFLNLVNKFYSIDEQIIKFTKTKTSLNNYNKDPLAHFTTEEIKTIYENNPKWAAIERVVYNQDSFILKI
jgi:hypothetical protein